MDIDIAFDHSHVRVPLGMRRGSAHSNIHTVSDGYGDQHADASDDNDTYAWRDNSSCIHPDATSDANRTESNHPHGDYASWSDCD